MVDWYITLHILILVTVYNNGVEYSAGVFSPEHKEYKYKCDEPVSYG